MCCLNDPHSIASEERIIIANKASSSSPSKNMIWYPYTTVVQSKLLYRLLHFLYHFIPAGLADVILLFKGSKLNVKRIYAKVYFFLEQYRYFMENTWIFSEDNMQSVYSKMTPADHEYFPTQITSQEIAETYFFDVWDGIKTYVLKETDEDAVEARRKYKILKAVYYLLWGSIYSCIGYFVYSKIIELYGTSAKA
jgi:alcohol-forming fatty acyl-CoA reductase